jgi:hypothetical protein
VATLSSLPLSWLATRAGKAAVLLLGALVSLQPLHSGAAGRLVPGGDAQSASLPPPLPRFAYLPVAPPPAPPAALAARGLAPGKGVAEKSAAGEDSSAAAMLKGFSARGFSAFSSALGDAAGGRLKAGAAAAVSGLGGFLGAASEAGNAVAAGGLLPVLNTVMGAP